MYVQTVGIWTMLLVNLSLFEKQVLYDNSIDRCLLGDHYGISNNHNKQGDRTIGLVKKSVDSCDLAQFQRVHL